MTDVFAQHQGKEFAAYNCDCVEFTATLPENSIDFSVYSPPFANLYIYSNSERDLGNVSSDEEFQAMYRPLVADLFRATKPGRCTAIHVKDLVYYSNASEKGDRGLRDFTGDCIRTHIEAGWTYHRRITIWRCPVREMQKTKSDRLLYKNFRTDGARTGGGMPEYVVVFRKWAEGMEETPPVIHDPARYPLESWQDMAQPSYYLEDLWRDTDETDTLNVKIARDEDAEKHLCLATGSEVLTVTGFKPIESIEVGEMVLTHLGRWRPILAKKYTGVRQVVTVRAQGVPGLTLTPDHKLWSRIVPQSGKWDATFARRRAAQTHPSWVRADATIGSYLNLKLPPIDDNVSLSTDDWWIVGRWLGDGHIGPRGEAIISCGHHESDFLVSKLGERCGFVFKNATATQIRLKDRDGAIREMIAKCGRGAENKQFPPEAFSLQMPSAKAVLDGYLSADGSFLESRNRFSATSVSKRLLLGASMLFQRVHGISASVFTGRKERRGVICGRDVSMRQEWVLSAYLSSPTQRVKPFILDDGAWLKVRSIEDAGHQGTWCIKVAEDESFTAEGCIVKNCPMPLDITKRLINQYSNDRDTIYSPFMGVGSEGYVALRNNRRFIGTELNQTYFKQACKYLDEAERLGPQSDLLSAMERAS